jgi:hypothetical protein
MEEDSPRLEAITHRVDRLENYLARGGEGEERLKALECQLEEMKSTEGNMLPKMSIVFVLVICLCRLFLS